MKNSDFTFLLKNQKGEEVAVLKEIRGSLEKADIPKEVVEAVLNSDITKEFIGNYTYQMLHYLLKGGEKIVITKEDFLELTKKNFPIMEEIAKKIGVSFEPEKVLSYLEKEDVMSFFPTANHFIQKIEEHSLELLPNFTLDNALFVLKLFLNPWGIGLSFFLFLESFICLALLQRKKAILYYKKSLLVVFFFFIGMEILLGTIVKDYLVNVWFYANAFSNYFINTISKSLWLILVFIFLIILVLLYIEKKVGKKDA